MRINDRYGLNKGGNIFKLIIPAQRQWNVCSNYFVVLDNSDETMLWGGWSISFFDADGSGGIEGSFFDAGLLLKYRHGFRKCLTNYNRCLFFDNSGFFKSNLG